MREIKKIKTPSGIELEIKTYLNAGENQKIVSLGITEDNKDMKKNIEAANKMVELAVVSIDGKKEDCLNVVLEMRMTDYNFVIGELTKIMSDEAVAPEKKEKDEQ